MKSLITQLFGTYNPVSYFETITTTNVDGETVTSYAEVIAAGAAGVDWAWVAGVALFAIVLWSFFRLVGLLLK